jgi:hypothetical protein
MEDVLDDLERYQPIPTFSFENHAAG